MWSVLWSGNEIFSTSFDCTVRSWDVATQVNTRILHDNPDMLLSMAIQHDSLWTGSLTGQLVKWDKKASMPLAMRLQSVTSCISVLEQSGSYLFVGGIKVGDDSILSSFLYQKNIVASILNNGMNGGCKSL